MSPYSRYSSAFGRQGDTYNFEGVYAAAGGGSGSVVIAGTAENEASDVTAVKIDANGKKVWTWQVKLNIFPCFHGDYCPTAAIFALGICEFQQYSTAASGRFNIQFRVMSNSVEIWPPCSHSQRVFLLHFIRNVSSTHRHQPAT